MNTFWDEFYEQPLDKVPWNKTQADWFVKLVETGVIKGSSALDVGCGVGAKSIFLTQRGFEEVIGIDIAAKAIEYAKKKAEELSFEDKCAFHVHDVTDLSFLPSDKQFDLVLDWATLHCIKESKRRDYVKQIIERIKPGGLFLLRTFSNRNESGSFEEKVGGQTITIHTFTEDEVFNLYKGLNVIDKNISLPRTKQNLQFLEVLFKKGE